MSTFKVEIELPARKLFRNVDGEAKYIEFANIPANVLGELLVGGANIIANNSFNGAGGAERKTMTDAQKMAIVQKRFDAWYKGSYVVVDRDASQAGLMREAYLREVIDGEMTPAKVKAAEDQMRKRVKDVLGDVNATFDNFLEAQAMMKARAEVKADKATARTAEQIKALLVAKYEAAAAQIAKTRAEEAAAIKIDMDDIDI